MNRRPLLAWTAGLLILALSFPALAGAASLAQDPGPQPQLFTIKGHVAAQGRSDQQQVISLALRLDSKEPVIDVYPEMKTNEAGEFSFDVVGVPGDKYTWRVKGLQTLATTGSFQLEAIDLVEMGTQLTGDANDDNVVNTTDFNILRGTYGKNPGDGGYDGRADFTGEGAVTILDFNLLRGNIGKAGEKPLGN